MISSLSRAEMLLARVIGYMQLIESDNDNVRNALREMEFNEQEINYFIGDEDYKLYEVELEGELRTPVHFIYDRNNKFVALSGFVGGLLYWSDNSTVQDNREELKSCGFEDEELDWFVGFSKDMTEEFLPYLKGERYDREREISLSDLDEDDQEIVKKHFGIE